jgi:hypothetical protein
VMGVGYAWACATAVLWRWLTILLPLLKQWSATGVQTAKLFVSMGP